MKVNEVFYSLQGEGARAGEPSLFIRLAGCSAKFACSAAGVACDTEFEAGTDLSREDVLMLMHNMAPSCDWIVWTGGEPTDQLTGEDVAWFSERGYHQAIETSGIRPVPPGLDWVTISPKVAEHVLAKHFPQGVTELKYVRHAGQAIPLPQVAATYYFLSPHSDGVTINVDNMKACIALCLENPPWRLSLQQHKLWQIR